MSDNNTNQDIRRLLDALDASISEDDSSYFKTTHKEADERLAELKITPGLALKKLDQILDAARGKARLERGKARREKFTAVFAKCQNAMRQLAPVDKEEILALLKGISPDRTEAIEAYFRKFEESSEKDVQSLREDLEMLRAMKEDTEANDAKPDKS